MRPAEYHCRIRGPMVEVAARPQLPAQTNDMQALVAAALRNLRLWAEADRAQAGLWVPAIFGAGAAAYLLSPREPSFGFAVFGLFAGVAVSVYWARARLPALVAAIFMAGFLCADIRTASVAAPVIERELEFASVTGRLATIDEAAKVRRLVIDVETIDKLPADRTPERIRVSWRGKSFDALPGDRVRIRASLSPPPRPAAPGGFDFARQLYFQRIGAVGFALSPPEVLQSEERSLKRRVAASIEKIRLGLSRRILKETGGDSGAILAAVVTGKRAAISEEAEAIFRDSGLAHLLSISGLHMGLATGLIFFAVRAALALIEPIALSQPIKKWSALAALASGAAYLLVSGAAWPAQRAFLMSSIFFVAILADRRALTLRNVAIAAFVIVLLTPEAVLHPGFQMSFAAVTALISFYEWASKRADPMRSFNLIARLRRYVVGIAVTDTIAAAATAPFSLYHFSRAANFGLAANIVSVPLMGFWVMPAAIIAIVAMPFGVDGPIWRAAAAGIEVMMRIGDWTIGLPGAVTVFRHWPPFALGALSIGGLWLCLMTAPWRLAGLLSIPLAAALIAATPHPRIYFSDTGDNVGVVLNSESVSRAFAVYDRRKGRFDSGVWMEQSGLDTQRAKALLIRERFPCDENGCVLELAGKNFSISANEIGLLEDCLRADLVIALYPVSKRDRDGCNAPILDRKDAHRNGAHSIYLSNDGFRIESVSQRRGHRPWSG